MKCYLYMNLVDAKIPREFSSSEMFKYYNNNMLMMAGIESFEVQGTFTEKTEHLQNGLPIEFQKMLKIAQSKNSQVIIMVHDFLSMHHNPKMRHKMLAKLKELKRILVYESDTNSTTNSLELTNTNILYRKDIIMKDNVVRIY